MLQVAFSFTTSTYISYIHFNGHTKKNSAQSNKVMECRKTHVANRLCIFVDPKTGMR